MNNHPYFYGGDYMNIENLANAIKNETKKYMKLVNLLGNDHPMTVHVGAEIYGMQKAFAIITGKTYTDYLLEDMVC